MSRQDLCIGENSYNNICLTPIDLTRPLGNCDKCGADQIISSRSLLLPGSIVASVYEVQSIIGAGGNGQVYRVRTSQGNQEDYALKETSRPGIESLNFDLLETLDHPSLPRFYYEFADSGYAYILMDFIKGGSLYRKLQINGALPESEVLQIAGSLLDATEYLHDHGIIHKDIKPANTIIRYDPQTGHLEKLFLVDMGIAKRLGNRTDTIAKAGTDGYASLEHHIGGTDKGSDVYSLAATLHHALTGNIPPDVLQRIAGSGKIEDLNQTYHNRSISPKVAASIMKGLEVFLVDRYSTVAEFRDDLLNQRQLYSGTTFQYPNQSSFAAPTINLGERNSITEELQSLAALSELKGRKVYITYHEDDFTYAEILANAFRKTGIVPWIKDDDNNFIGGEKYKYTQSRALEESDIIISLISKNTSNHSDLSTSQRMNVHWEMRKALETQELLPYGAHTLFPILLDQNARLPDSIHTANIVPARIWDPRSMQSLRESIINTIKNL